MGLPKFLLERSVSPIQSRMITGIKKNRVTNTVAGAIKNHALNDARIRLRLGVETTGSSIGPSEICQSSPPEVLLTTSATGQPPDAQRLELHFLST